MLTTSEIEPVGKISTSESNSIDEVNKVNNKVGGAKQRLGKSKI